MSFKTALLLPVLITAILGLTFPAVAVAQGRGVRMSLRPASGEYQTGEEFTTEILLDTRGTEVITAEARIKYDTAKLELVDLSYGEISGQYADVVREDRGLATIILMRVSEFSWNGVFASLKFKALQSGTASVELVYDPTGSSDDSGVYSLASESDLLEEVAGASYSLAGEGLPTATATPASTTGVVLTVAPEPTPTVVIEPTTASELAQIEGQSTHAPTEAPPASELPNTSIPYITYILAGMAAALLLMGAKLAVVRA